MDGEKYEVTLDFFYSQLGPMYALKFRKRRIAQGKKTAEKSPDAALS